MIVTELQLERGSNQVSSKEDVSRRGVVLSGINMYYLTLAGPEYGETKMKWEYLWNGTGNFFMPITSDIKSPSKKI